MNRKLILLASLALLISCSKKPIQVSPLEATNTLSTNGLVYSLPRNVIRVKVQSVKTVVVPGPYSRFAQKYLGIIDAPLKKVEEWRIANVELSYVLESDPNALFAVLPSKDSKVDFLKICNTGLIIPVSGFGANAINNSNIRPVEVDGKVVFPDMSTSPFIAAEKNTFYSKVKKDSVFVRVPIQKDMIVEKNLEEKARDAADFIFLLRKRRADFISPDADHNLNGEGLRIALDEINWLEQEYLSLFIGKSFTETGEHQFEFIPTEADGESTIIFRLSGSKGVLPSSDLSGNPYLLKSIIEPLPNSYNTFFQNLAIEKDKPVKEAIYYRLPVTALFSISDGKTELASRRISIYQYGKVIRMPLNLVVKDSGLIEFQTK